MIFIFKKILKKNILPLWFWLLVTKLHKILLKVQFWRLKEGAVVSRGNRNQKRIKTS